MNANHNHDIQIPAFLSPFFWDCDYSTLRWKDHSDFIMKRILNNGSWDAVRWLRKEIGDEVIERWLVAHKGRGIEKRQLRFWEAILSLHHEEVSNWLNDPLRKIWDDRNSN